MKAPKTTGLRQISATDDRLNREIDAFRKRTSHAALFPNRPPAFVDVTLEPDPEGESGAFVDVILVPMKIDGGQ